MEKLFTKLLWLVAAIVVITAVILIVILNNNQTSVNSLGSVDRTSEYLATSSNSLVSVNTPIRKGAVTLGSVVITGANTGTMDFYDATTTNITARGGTATSSIWIASFPASTAAGTYVFDSMFKNGLYLITSGSKPTTTITYR